MSDSRLTAYSLIDVEQQDLIEVFNELQNKFVSCGRSLDISLPQIVVVGSQSAGKSSVLENIVGREFLPRGTGVVTRRPTVVQLLPHTEVFAVFLHKPDEKFRDFIQVKQEIINETLKDPGPVGFSSNPISLKIYSPDVLKLTLVDLPGLIKNTVDNQSEESIEEVRRMVLDFIIQPNSLILAVTPANQDIASSDALEIAKVADPQRIRTMGVLTKLDIMDEGTNARDVLENKKIPLKRGYFGVLNRSQKDIENAQDINYCLNKEKNFFESMPCYRHMADRMGTPYLRKMLNQQLYEHIRASLPAVRQELFQKLAEFNKDLKDLKTKFGYDASKPVGVQYYVIRLVETFIERFHVDIFGNSEKVNIHKLSSGAMINFTLCQSIQNNFMLPSLADKNRIIVAITNLLAIRNGFSMPSLALETVIKELFSEYLAPLQNLVDNIAKILIFNAEKLTDEMECCSTLKNELLYLIRKSTDESVSHTKESFDNHLEAEKYFVNIYHCDFEIPKFENAGTFFPMKLWNYGKRIVKTAVCDEDYGDCDCDEKQALEILSSNDCMTENVKILSEMIEKYVQVSQKNIQDIATKYIMFFLIKNVMDFVRTGLIPMLLECPNADLIFEECEKDLSKISEIESTCQCLEDALIAVQTF